MAKRERNLNWQVYGSGQLDNCTLIGVLFYLTSNAGEF